MIDALTKKQEKELDKSRIIYMKKEEILELN